uniref:Nucleoside diphosphate kinase n=1 Tax=Denticeps clupeoides TaxID=299321 RepID=A0AAY4CXH0_9TELE
ASRRGTSCAWTAVRSAPRSPSGDNLLTRQKLGARVRERTLVAVKPDGVQRRLVGQIIQRFETRGFKLVGLKMLQVWEGHNVVKSTRMLVGDTNPAEAKPGTIRGDFSIHISRNIIHASDSVEVAQAEIALWFRRSELMEWECCDHGSVYQL